MATAVYVLCALTALGCAILLLRAYSRSRLNLLLWSGLCFTGLAVSNFFLVLDLVIFTGYDLALARQIPTLAGLGVLIYGLVLDSGR